MTTRVHLVRHGQHGLLGRVLCGRGSAVELDATGIAQMNAVADELSKTQPDAVQASPQRRTVQSAAIIARRCMLPVEVVPAVDELDVGMWTGLEFETLDQQPAWREWNERRGSSLPPGGEGMAALQRRMVAHIESLRTEMPEASMVIVSHAEPIRAALMHYLGIPLDDFMKVAVDPASVSTLSMNRRQVRVSRLNGAPA